MVNWFYYKINSGYLHWIDDEDDSCLVHLYSNEYNYKYYMKRHIFRYSIFINATDERKNIYFICG